MNAVVRLASALYARRKANRMTESNAAPARQRYTAFISYSHQDEALAGWLHRALESYRTPRTLVDRPGDFGPVPKRAGRCFRDRAELSASDDLAREIREALDESDALIVLCSPKSAGSPYVEEEIRYFKSLGRGRRILAAIVAGEPHAAGKAVDGRTLTETDECFPRALLHAIDANGAISDQPEPHEFIAADFRKGKDDREFGKLKLLAGLFGVGLDDLVQRERQAAHWRMRLYACAAFAFAGLAIAAMLFALEAQRQRAHAETQLQIARAHRMAGEAQLALARAADLDRMEQAGTEGTKSDYSIDDESIAFERQRMVERAALLSLESLNTAETEEGEQALRMALAMLWPPEVRRALRGERLLGWGGDANTFVISGASGSPVAIDLSSGALSPVKAPPTGADWGANLAEGDTLKSPDDRYTITGSTEQYQALELTGPGAATPRILQHEWTNPRVMFSPDSRYLVTLTGQVSMEAADPGAEALPGSALRVFETSTARLGFHLSMAQDGGVTASALSPDGSKLATAISDLFGRGGIKIWTLWPKEARDEACHRLTRNLSHTEWTAYVRDRPYAETCPGLPAVEQ